MTPINAELLRLFGFWSSVLVFKMMIMVPLTARQRFNKKVFANPEDTEFKPNSKVSYNDPDVERVRRAHLNDLENILPWFIITYIWLTTGPSVWLAGLLIRTFVFARIFHTLVYALFPHQPSRVITFLFGFFITGYEAFSSLMYYL